jgi:hypothetical protein
MEPPMWLFLMMMPGFGGEVSSLKLVSPKAIKIFLDAPLVLFTLSDEVSNSAWVTVPGLFD